MYTGLIWGIIFGSIGLILLFTRMRHHDYNQTTNILGIIFIIISAILILFSFIRVVPAGTVGVVDIFGKVSDQERLSGLNLVNPLAKLEIMNIKTEEAKEVMAVPSKEGLTIELEISILYRLSPQSASEVYKTVGPDYRDIIIVPQFRSVCRGVTVNYEAKALYTSSREEIAEKIFKDLKDMLLERGIILERVLLRAIRLPPTVSQAIEMKLRAEQEAEQMKFVLQKERQEAERKIIEAEGIAKAQEIINKTLSPAYLQYQAIQAQMKMADSPNHTTVYIPSGDNGIPLVRIVGDDTSQTSNTKR